MDDMKSKECFTIPFVIHSRLSRNKTDMSICDEAKTHCLASTRYCCRHLKDVAMGQCRVAQMYGVPLDIGATTSSEGRA